MDHPKILESWKEIAAHLNRNVRTCQMWEQDHGLPIHRLDGSPKARVFAYPDELDRWFQDKTHEHKGGNADRLPAGKAGSTQHGNHLPTLPRWNIGLIASLAITACAALATAAWLLDRQAKIRWANDIAIPEIERLMTATDFDWTAKLAFRAEKYIPKSPRLARLIPQVTAVLSVETDPPGARIEIADYSGAGEDWRQLGISPVADRRLSQGYKHWRISRPGFETAEGTLCVDSGYASDLKIKLGKKGEVPPGMVRITGGDYSPFIRGLSDLRPVKLGDYFLDRNEVTNRQFLEFVETGGYQKKEYWKEPFVKDGRVVPWEEGIREFVDKTGRPGPAAWEIGDYPQGQDDYPVSGVSWYEASAYAEYAGKRLPTVYHWNRAVFSDIVYAITGPYCNLQGRAPAPVGSFKSLGPFGTYDLAGNVKEWCSNAIGGERLILGGAWNEAQYMAVSPDRYPPFFRAQNFGFRCFKPESDQADPPEATAPVSSAPPVDFGRMRPCSDEVFEVFRDLYDYAKTDLAARIKYQKDLSEDTRVEKVTYADPVDGKRIMAYLFIPRRGRPPFQTIVYCPGGTAWRSSSVLDYGAVHSGEVELFNRRGRAFVIPVLPGAFDRWDGRSDPDSAFLDSSQHLKDFLIGVYRGFSRCIDYLETRPEFDTQRLAFQSLSWGAWMGPLVVALERRFKAAVFLSGGLAGWPYKPFRYAAQADMVNFAPRIKVPVLVQNGRYDCEYPTETNVRPLFELFGTPEKDKHLILYETGHSVWLANEYRRDILIFLDRYLGPVRQGPGKPGR